MRLLLGIGGRPFQFEQLLSDVEEGARIAHAMEGAFGRGRRRRVALVVTNKGRSGEIEMEVALRLVKKAWSRLAALATLLPIVRAIIDCVDSAARLRDLPLHPAMDGLEVGLAHEAAADARLIRRDDCAVACL